MKALASLRNCAVSPEPLLFAHMKYGSRRLRMRIWRMSIWPAQLQRLASLEILDLASVGYILSSQRTTKTLIRLRGCTVWSVPLLFAYGIRQVFSWWGSFPVMGWLNQNLTYNICFSVAWHNWLLKFMTHVIQIIYLTLINARQMQFH